MSITDQEGAKLVAQRLFDYYDTDKNGILQEKSLADMLSNTYRVMNKGFEPSAEDVETYKRVIDQDMDGIVTYKDIEKVAIKYLTKINNANRF